MITGWVERNKNNKFSGWISMQNQWSGSQMYIVVLDSGKRQSVKPINVAKSKRPDLARLEHAYNIEFEMDSDEFYRCASIGTVQFLISYELQEFALKLTPQLIYHALKMTGGVKGGLAFGRVSTDGAAVVGAGGNIYLKTGSNNVESMYLDAFNIDVDGWIELLHKRHSMAVSDGYAFFQIFIPEKSSVTYWNVPFAATKGSPGFNILLNKITEDQLLSRVTLSNLDYVPDEVHSEGIFRSFDTHLSTLGAKIVVDKFLERFFGASQPLYKVDGVFFGEAHGDIGSRFLEDGKVIEKPPLYTGLSDLDGRPLVPVKISSFDPPTGNIGIRRAWSCENAPIQKRVLCFGGSSFERGGVSSTLSWWFSRLFKEFHFCWSPECLSDVLSEVDPEVLICQSIERFLNVLPKK